jgi:hypothetical protein
MLPNLRVRKESLVRVAKYTLAILGVAYLLLLIHVRYFWRPDLQPFMNLITRSVNEVAKPLEKSHPPKPR